MAQLVRALELAILITGSIPNEVIPLISDLELWDCSTDSYSANTSRLQSLPGNPDKNHPSEKHRAPSLPIGEYWLKQ